MTTYSISRPKIGIVVYLLFGILVTGFVALFMAADFAFQQVTQSRVQAVFAALLVEAGMVIDAIAVLRAARLRDNWPAALGLAVSLVVSGTYNYVQASKVGALHSVTQPWQLWTLALGPLSALMFLALAVGSELRLHEQKVATWEADRQTWLDAETRRLADEHRQEQDRQEEREHRMAEDRLHEQERQEEHKRLLRQMELDAQLKAEKDKAARELRERRREERKAERLAQGEQEKQTQDLAGDVNTLAASGNTRLAILDFYRKDPKGSQADAARASGVSRTRVGQLLQALEKEGAISRNGSVKVL